MHHYVITVFNDTQDKQTNEHKILADFYKHPFVSQMAKTYSKSLAGLMYESEYTFTIVAYDSWDHASDPFVFKIKTTTFEEPQILITSEHDKYI